VAVIDATGKLVEHHTIFPHQGEQQRTEAAALLTDVISRNAIELIAIGNGTAGRETDEFISSVIAATERKPVKVIVNEAGASVYSASPAAVEEFPGLDVTVRGAVSIGRRLQDPLAELVKIDPKAIGVGQYQHDVDQKLLRKQLAETVESCVNFVGVELNTASNELLRYVAGINSAIARSIVAHRNEKGPFTSREQLRGVPKMGPKAFEQAAGFLRIRGAEDPLDNTGVHPESYPVARRIISDLGIPFADIPSRPDLLNGIDLKKYVTETVGEPTLCDIVSEIQRPGRDPRTEFKYAKFREDVKEIKDLKPGMELEGVVTNVANFGAFVDVGVHHDGLVHVSQLADRFVADPKMVVHVGQIVKVRILEVNEALKRISLTMKSPGGGRPKQRPKQGKKPHPKTPKGFTLDDLKAKFNNR
jgi:uncharacterized protein